MRKLAFCSMLVLMTCLMSAQPLTAQERGPGGFLDWLHKLSGPSMTGMGGSYWWTVGERARFRLEGAYRIPVARKETIDAGHGLNILSLQPSFEIPIIWYLEIKTGINVHRFGGEGHSAEWNTSIPLYAQIRYPVDTNETVFLRIAAGLHYFRPFADDAFDGGVQVNRGSGEGTLALLVGLDFMR